jgi:hypothetical protein
MLLIGSFGKDGKYFDDCVQSVSNFPLEIGAYFLIVNISSAYAGHWGHERVRNNQWDLKYRLFRFRNEWFYLLTGEINCFSEFSKEDNKIPNMVAISGVIDSCDKSYLYVGMLVDFHFDKDGNLDRLLITEAQRRDLVRDKSNKIAANKLDKRFYPIDGDYFILKYSEIKNLNIRYIYFEKEDR